MPDDPATLKPIDIACPACGHAFPVTMKAALDSQYRFRMTIELQGDRLISAVDAGTAIRATGELLQEIAKADGKAVEVAVASIDYAPTAMTVDYVVAERIDREEGGAGDVQ